MKETNGRILEVFEGDCFMFKADKLLAPDLQEAQERYSVYIDDTFLHFCFMVEVVIMKKNRYCFIPVFWRQDVPTV